MNTKYLDTELQWHCRRGGGLFCGVILNFPLTRCDTTEFILSTHRSIMLKVGLIFGSVIVRIKYNHTIRHDLIDREYQTKFITKE